MHFILLFGPPAVGKMAVGKELETLTGVRLFHNHMSIEPALKFFPFGNPSLGRVVGAFREAVFQEVASSDLPGLCFTYVWDLDGEGDRRFVQRTCDLFSDRGAKVFLVELRATLEARLERNRGEDRLREKPSKRDVAASERNLLEVGQRHRLNSAGDVPVSYPHLCIDNTNLSPAEAASQIAESIGLMPKPASENDF